MHAVELAGHDAFHAVHPFDAAGALGRDRWSGAWSWNRICLTAGPLWAKPFAAFLQAVPFPTLHAGIFQFVLTGAELEAAGAEWGKRHLAGGVEHDRAIVVGGLAVRTAVDATSID